MAEEIRNQTSKIEEKKVEEKKPSKEEISKSGAKNEAKSDESKNTQKKPSNEKPKVRESAVANGYSLRISPKYAISICKVIKGKSPEEAVRRLSDVVVKKRAIPMAGREVAHQKGKGLAGAKFPKNACIAIKEIVTQAGANALVAGIENPIITLAVANRASAPMRRGGTKSKRTHVKIEVKDKIKLVGQKKE